MNKKQMEKIAKQKTKLMLLRKENILIRKNLNKIATKISGKKLFYKQLLKAYSKKNKQFNIKKIENNNKKYMVVINSDLQIGSKVDISNNTFNNKTLLKRQKDFLSKVEYYKNLYKIKDFLYIDLGDAIDHNSMRLGHKMDLENPFQTITSQMKEWTNLQSSTLTLLSKWGSVKRAMVPSNHCRINGTKELNHFEDDYSTIIDMTIKQQFPNTKIKKEDIDKKNGISLIRYGGKKFVITHGDKLPNKPNIHIDNWVKNIKSTYGVNFDFLLTGHYHHTFIGDNHFGVGSIMGTNSFSAKLGLTSKPSQGIIIIDNNEIIAIPIYLK